MENRTIEEARRNEDRLINQIELLEQENQSLKKQLEERPKEYVFIGNAQNKTRDFINQIIKENQKYKEVIDNIKRFCTSNEWGKYYEISSCRNHILDILKEVE